MGDQSPDLQLVVALWLITYHLGYQDGYPRRIHRLLLAPRRSDREYRGRLRMQNLSMAPYTFYLWRTKTPLTRKARKEPASLAHHTLPSLNCISYPHAFTMHLLFPNLAVQVV